MNRFLHYLLVLCMFTGCMLIQPQSANAQVNAYEGKHFWCSFIKPQSAFTPSNTITIFSRTNTTVTLRNQAKSYSQTVNLAANTPQDITVSFATSSSDTAEVIGNYAIEVISAANIQVEMVGYTNFGDGTMVFPVENLGTEYYGMSFDGTASGKSAIVVVATEDFTAIDITPSVQTSGGKQSGQTYTKILQKGETYRVEGFGYNDLSGTKIKVTNGCKPIAVFSGSVCSQIPTSCLACGQLYEMMPHVDMLGKKYHIAPLVTGGFQTPQYTYKILSITNGTVVTVNGSASTLNQGATITINGNKNTETTCIDATKPVLVVQYAEGYACQGGGSPRMMYIAPAEQLVKSAIIMGNITLSTGNPHNIIIVTRTAARLRLRLNGSIIPSSNYSTFSNCADWSYVSVNVSRGPHTIVSDSGFLAYMYYVNFNSAYMVTAASNARITKYDAASESPKCGSTSATFYNSGDSTNIATSLWEFDDNTSLTGKKVTKVFPAQGVYGVRNIVQYNDVCPHTDTLTYSVRTIPLPKVGFSINNPVQCFIGNEFVFNDTTKYINGSKQKTNLLSFSDTLPTFKNVLNYTRVFGKSGTTVKVKLIVETADLCVDSAESIITINANAKPDYTITNPQCFKSHVFSPVQKSTVPGSTIVGYEWDFGDGTTGTQATPAKKYALDSTYNITLIAKAATGCNDTIRRTFTIYPSPTAAFTTSSACINDTLKAVNTSSFSSALTYLWKTGDGNSYSTTDIKKQYADTGTYNIVLTATTQKGCPDSSVKTVGILPAPKPSFTYVKQCTQNPTVFTNSTFTYNTSGVQYTWDLGDSTTFLTPNATHKYIKEGDFLIALYAKLPNGCQDSVKRHIYINPKPKVDFTINDSLQCIRGNSFDFFNSTVLTEGKIKQFVWLLNDTFLSNSTSINNKVFTTHGANTMKLVASTDSLCADSIVKFFEIAPQTNLDIAPATDTQCFKNHAFILTNNSSIPAGTVKYRWTYSNSDVDTVVQPAPKTFGSAGRFQLTLLALSDKGCRDSLIRNFTIYPSPELDFEVNDVCGSDSARFLNFSKVTTGRIVNWIWNLGDGDSSTDKRPVHKYNTFGPFDITMIGITDLGCPDTTHVDTALTVKPAPFSFFNTNLVEQRGTETTYDFNDLSVDADNYYWNFDRGQTSREENPRFTFRDTGFYNITLTVSNNEGCFSSHDTSILVVPDIEVYIPNAFTPNKDIMNPVFRIEGSYFYREFEMQIFDRWGQRVYYSIDPEQGWDGTFDGRKMPEGVYIYSIRIMGTDTKVRNYKGNLHLLY